MSLRGRVVISAFLHPKIDWNSLKVIRRVVLDSVPIYMLQNAHCIRIRSIVVLTKEVSLNISLVKLCQVLLEHSHFNDFLHKLRQVWQGYEGFVKKPYLCRRALLVIALLNCNCWCLHKLIISSIIIWISLSILLSVLILIVVCLYSLWLLKADTYGTTASYLSCDSVLVIFGLLFITLLIILHLFLLSYGWLRWWLVWLFPFILAVILRLRSSPPIIPTCPFGLITHLIGRLPIILCRFLFLLRPTIFLDWLFRLLLLILIVHVDIWIGELLYLLHLLIVLPSLLA